MGKYSGFFDDVINEPQQQAPQAAPKSRYHGYFDDVIQQKPASKPADNPEDLSAIIDPVAGIGRGFARFAAGTPGIPGDVANLLALPGDYARSKGWLPQIPKDSAFSWRPYGSEDYIRGLSPYVEALREKSTTTPGKYTQRIAEFAPMAGRRLISQGVAPAVATEGADQFTKGSSANKWAPGAAGVLTSIAGMVAGRPPVAHRVIRDAVGQMTPEQITAMENMMRDAERVGVPLTRAEAAQHVTNGATRLADIQRVVEGQGGMRDFFGARPQQIEAAGRRAFDEIAPITDNPSLIGESVAGAAKQAIQGRQGAINRATRNLYNTGAAQSIPPAAQAALASDPLYARALDEVLNDPAMNRMIAGLPQDSQAVADLVRQRLQEQASSAAIPGQASTSNIAAANYGDAARAARAASPAIDPARAAQSQLRQQYLAPLISGPLGKIMDREETQGAINALFPQNPLPNSSKEVFDAVRRLSGRAPEATQQLVRAHVESVFNQATRDFQKPGNEFGGAAFRSKLVGNPQQEENLTAALSALPNGQRIVDGFNRMLEVMAATGQRQRIGSQTAFNQELQAQLKSGTLVGEGAAIVGGAGMKWPQKVMDAYSQWSMGRNVDQLAYILTSPNAAQTFRDLASAPRGSARAARALARLAVIANESSRKREDKPGVSGRVDFAPQRASGGRVMHKARKLDAEASRTLKALGGALNPIMDMPDEAVANALRIAKHQ